MSKQLSELLVNGAFVMTNVLLHLFNICHMTLKRHTFPPSSCSRSCRAAGAGWGTAKGAVSGSGGGAGLRGETRDPAGAAEGGSRGQPGCVGGTLQNNAAAAARDTWRQRRKDLCPLSSVSITFVENYLFELTALL